MSDEEKHARRLVNLMRAAGTSAGQIMMWGAIEASWLSPDNAKREELLSGLKYAVDQGWIEQVDESAHALRLTAKGAAV